MSRAVRRKTKEDMKTVAEMDYIKHVKLVVKEMSLPSNHMEDHLKRCLDQNITVHQCVMEWREECQKRKESAH